MVLTLGTVTGAGMYRIQGLLAAVKKRKLGYRRLNKKVCHVLILFTFINSHPFQKRTNESDKPCLHPL